MKGHFTMSNIELDRLQVLQKIMEHRMTQAAAAQVLGLSYRQVKRLMARFRRQGAAGLVSGKRGKQGDHRLPTIYTDHIWTWCASIIRTSAQPWPARSSSSATGC
jgi:transposase